MIKVNAHILNHLSGDANINVIATLEDLCNGQHTSSTTTMKLCASSPAAV